MCSMMILTSVTLLLSPPSTLLTVLTMYFLGHLAIYDGAAIEIDPATTTPQMTGDDTPAAWQVVTP
jgi:hypothetical protein